MIKDIFPPFTDLWFLQEIVELFASDEPCHARKYWEKMLKSYSPQSHAVQQGSVYEFEVDYD